MLYAQFYIHLIHLFYFWLVENKIWLPILLEKGEISNSRKHQHDEERYARNTIYFRLVLSTLSPAHSRGVSWFSTNFLAY